FKEELTGPQYANRYMKELKQYPIEVLLNTTVTNLTRDKVVTLLNEEGEQDIQASAVVLAMGCRERNRGAIHIPGTRPVGVMTAGTAQRYLNIDGYLVGKKVFILGSGDIGLIMARRMSLEGAKVLGVAEIMPYSNGLTRNIVQCLHDYEIPLYLSHTITNIHGDERVEGITISEVDAQFNPIVGTEKQFEVDTVLLSVGLIPDNGLSKKAGVEFDPVTKGALVYHNLETNVPGIFACGNVLHVHDLVDFVSLEAKRAGANAAAYVQHKQNNQGAVIQTMAGRGVGYVVPQKISTAMDDVELFFRVNQKFNQVCLQIKCGDTILKEIRKKQLLPAEMEKVLIPKELLSQVNQTLTLEILSKEAN
ncbi:MAG TPA: pyridine nucleotide-disulfide oxidoreductase, partial [Firmicutes bacterium]|nr:pyridine nucleotide-disulfide oxidoreductase [Bacillota bacterium]